MKHPLPLERISRTCHGAGSRTPDPTATPGSLLEMIQIARQRVAGIGGDGYDRPGRAECLAAAVAQGPRLDALRARDGLREYVVASPSPWEALWMQVGGALGIEVATAARKLPSQGERLKATRAARRALKAQALAAVRERASA